MFHLILPIETEEKIRTYGRMLNKKVDRLIEQECSMDEAKRMHDLLNQSVKSFIKNVYPITDSLNAFQSALDDLNGEDPTLNEMIAETKMVITILKKMDPDKLESEFFKFLNSLFTSPRSRNGDVLRSHILRTIFKIPDPPLSRDQQDLFYSLVGKKCLAHFFENVPISEAVKKESKEEKKEEKSLYYLSAFAWVDQAISSKIYPPAKVSRSLAGKEDQKKRTIIQNKMTAWFELAINVLEKNYDGRTHKTDIQNIKARIAAIKKLRIEDQDDALDQLCQEWKEALIGKAKKEIPFFERKQKTDFEALGLFVKAMDEAKNNTHRYWQALSWILANRAKMIPYKGDATINLLQKIDPLFYRSNHVLQAQADELKALCAAFREFDKNTMEKHEKDEAASSSSSKSKPRT